MHIELQPAYLLHSRNYRDSSVIADMWTFKHGRVAVLIKGARRRKGGSKHLLIPFTPLLISCRGKSELKTLTHIEFASESISLQQIPLFSGFYLNELLLRLLPLADATPELFSRYSETIESLFLAEDIEPALRTFEWYLLQQLGYGLNFSFDAQSQAPIMPGQCYMFDSAVGFVSAHHGGIEGAHLLAIAAGNYDELATRRVAKLIARQALQSILGSKPLNSREMFKQLIS